jgi:hypothetical protein
MIITIRFLRHKKIATGNGEINYDIRGIIAWLITGKKRVDPRYGM